MNIPACITHEPAAQYHAKAKDYLSSHRLGDFRKCPLLYFKKQEGLIHDHDSPAYIEGRAAHSLILEGRSIYESEFITDVHAPVNPRTGKPFGSTSDKYKEWAEGQLAAGVENWATAGMWILSHPHHPPLLLPQHRKSLIPQLGNRQSLCFLPREDSFYDIRRKQGKP